MKLIKASLFPLAWLLTLLTSPLAYSKSPYAGNQSHSNIITVPGYTKQAGTYVVPDQRTAPNGAQRESWSSKPNVNPYTGKEVTKEPQK